MDKREVRREEGAEFARSNGLSYVEISVRNRTNLGEVLGDLAPRAIKVQENRSSEDRINASWWQKIKGLISIFGDTVCQKLIEKKSWSDFSFKRTLRQCSVSLLYTAPIGHLWFGILLPKIVKPLTYKPARVLTSVILDNTVYASFIITTGVFFLELLKTGSVETSVGNVQKKFWTMFVNSAQFWSAVSLINHTFLPMHYRVVFGNSCGVIWQVYMSYMVNAAKPNQELVESATTSKNFGEASASY